MARNPIDYSANFVCNVPRAAFSNGDGATGTAVPARPSLYGHGLLGTGSEVSAGNVQAMGNEHNVLFCATDWSGFATSDLPSVLATLQDASNFPKLVDRMQQGFLNFNYIGRALLHADGFAADPAFQDASGASLIDRTRLYYDGNSQGGIMGGALTALAPDFTRLRALPVRGVICTARSSSAELDFVSRFFAPGSGIDEDPVTGSAHCALGPYWAEKLGGADFVAYQASARGGTVRVGVRGERVLLGGCAVTAWRGELADD